MKTVYQSEREDAVASASPAWQTDSTDLELLYWEALTSLEGFGHKTWMALLAKAGSAEGIWNASDALIKEALPQKKQELIFKRRDIPLNEAWLNRHRELSIQVIAYPDSNYPPLLKEIHDPPGLLYVKGALSALTSKTIAVVGTRNASEYGRQVTEKLIRELVPASATIISGLASGIDTVAHWTALQSGLLTVAVFGCGLDIIAPSANRRLSQEIIAQGGALVSEYKLGTQASKYTFPQRNRIVAGLSHGVLVVEGDIKSGALITAKLGLEEGRSVFAVPGNIYNSGSQGPLYLIQNGAVPVSCGQDILRELQWWLPSGKSQPDLNAAQATVENFTALSDVEKQVLGGISYDPVSVENLSQTTGLPFAKINEILTLLELEGLIVLMPGAKVCRR